MPQLLKKPSRPVCAIPQRGSSDPMPNPMGFIWETLMIPVCDYWKHRRCFHRRSGYLDNLGPGVLQKFASNCASLFATVNKLFLVCCCWYDLPDSLCKSGCPLWQQQKQPKGGGGGLAQTDKTKNWKKPCEALECVFTADCTLGWLGGETAETKHTHRSEGNTKSQQGWSLHVLQNKCDLFLSLACRTQTPHAETCRAHVS